MERTVFGVIERVLERADLTAEVVLAGMMQALVDAYGEALERDPVPWRSSRDRQDPDEVNDRVLEDLMSVALWQQTVHATLCDDHERDAARGGPDAAHAHALVRSHENLALAQGALMDLLDGCHAIALREAGLPPLREPRPADADTPPPGGGGSGDDEGGRERPTLRLAV